MDFFCCDFETPFFFSILFSKERLSFFSFLFDFETPHWSRVVRCDHQRLRVNVFDRLDGEMDAPIFDLRKLDWNGLGYVDPKRSSRVISKFQSNNNVVVFTTSDV
jgi:hypothetical protein